MTSSAYRQSSMQTPRHEKIDPDNRLLSRMPLKRMEAEGVSITRAQILLAERDARVSAAQLQEAWARLALLKAGSRIEEIREAEARRDAAAAVGVIFGATSCANSPASVSKSCD